MGGNALRRKDALDPHRVRPSGTQGLNNWYAQILRFRANDKIRAQTVDRDQDNVRADRRFFCFPPQGKVLNLTFMSSRPGLAAVIALMMLGCATKEETTQTTDWHGQAKYLDEYMSDRRIGGTQHRVDTLRQTRPADAAQ